MHITYHAHTHTHTYIMHISTLMYICIYKSLECHKNRVVERFKVKIEEIGPSYNVNCIRIIIWNNFCFSFSQGLFEAALAPQCNNANQTFFEWI